jgi:hypothetical protein
MTDALSSRKLSFSTQDPYHKPSPYITRLLYMIILKTFFYQLQYLNHFYFNIYPTITLHHSHSPSFYSLDTPLLVHFYHVSYATCKCKQNFSSHSHSLPFFYPVNAVKLTLNRKSMNYSNPTENLQCTNG